MTTLPMLPEFSSNETGLIVSGLNIYRLLGGPETLLPDYLPKFEALERYFQSGGEDNVALTPFQVFLTIKVVGLFHGLLQCGGAEISDDDGENIKEAGLRMLEDIYQRLMAFVTQQDQPTDLEEWKAVAQALYERQPVPLQA